MNFRLDLHPKYIYRDVMNAVLKVFMRKGSGFSLVLI